jgi:excisionase family DNA binding protein
MKDLFTTGEAAEICRVSQQTIIRCFDSGRLRGFRVPGSKFRRIPRQNLVKFMRDNNIPLDNLDSGRKKVLVVDDDAEIVELIKDILTRDGHYDIRTASSGYEAGMVTQLFHPDLILLDYMLPDVNGNVGVIRQEEIDQLLKAGAHAFVRKPFTITELTEKIVSVLQAA